MQVFIVRPFGTKRVIPKNNSDDKSVLFDFERVQTELIGPALAALGMEGGTTGSIFDAGEIREDMFSELLLADIVIADISIHNANVFYELGVRNALRDRVTVLIKCPGFDETPFDIAGYRYIAYDKNAPAAAIDALKLAISESRDSDRRADNPVFNMLPRLEAQDPEKFYAVPPGFTEEVVLAEAAEDDGKLALLAAEAEFFEWRLPALRLTGEALAEMRADEAARAVWEAVQKRKPKDHEAAAELATIYHRLAEKELAHQPKEARTLFAKSDRAVSLLLADKAALSSGRLAEANALNGRNAKGKWIASWIDCPDDKRGIEALQSPHWEESLQSYEMGYYTDLNHVYSGINALALRTIIGALAVAYPEAWAARYAEDDEAAASLAAFQKASSRLAGAVKFSIEAEKARSQGGDRASWLDIASADYLCLTSISPAKVESAYRRVLERCKQMQKNSIQKQLRLYQALQVLPQNTDAAQRAIAEQIDVEPSCHYLLFTGHMIDKPDRETPRFPPFKEAAARAAIREKIAEVVRRYKGQTFTGIAGGACGGDILFHEVCAELGIRTELFLALPRATFLPGSVSFAGGTWVERFDALYDKLTRHVLAETKALPQWLEKVENYTFWERNNLWMLQHALVNGGIHVTLIALWNGESGSGPGGTAHMVEATKNRGGKTEIIDIDTLG